MFDQYIDLNKFSDKELEELEKELADREKGLREELISIIKFSRLVKKERKRLEDKEN